MAKDRNAIIRLTIGILIFGALWLGWRATPSLSSSPAAQPQQSPETPVPFDLYLPVISVGDGGGTVPLPTHTITPTATMTPTLTAIPTPTITPTLTVTPTATITATITPIPTPTITPTLTVTPTATITPTATPTLKAWSGVHLGNKSRSGFYQWNEAELQRIDPDDPVYGEDAIWPSMIVVISNQLYNIARMGEACGIESAGIRLPDTVDYLRRASEAGSKVVIRLYPSPGNFEDWAITDPADPGYRQNRTLIADYPVGGDNCRPSRYRSPQDLADEMRAIHALNVENGFSEFGFEPANEPNIEWYDSIVSRPENFKPEVWVAMNRYFAKIYALSADDDFRIFTPPMAQSQFADGIDLISCNERYLYSTTDQKVTGYWHLQELIGEKSDGFSWHNYWDWGKEAYVACGEDGHHISFHFPRWMKDLLKQMGKPMIVTEADLFSPLQLASAPIKDKNNVLYATAAEVAASVQQFFAAEWHDGDVGPDLALWLLNDNTCDEERCPADDTCLQNVDPNAAGYCAMDHNWHEAYRDINDDAFEERAWFELWYLGMEMP